MGYISTILAAIFCATAPVASIQVLGSKTEQTAPSYRLGKETISAIRAAYEKGEYDAFLSEMNASYQETDLDGLIQTRQNQIPADFQEKWEQQFLELQKEKNQELLSALSDQDDSLFAEKVRSVAANLSTPQQEKAISRLNSFIAMAPGTGANGDENALIDLDLEYEYKLLHAQQKQREYQIALRMEKMERMMDLSKGFKDLPLKEAVGLASANLDARLARNLDGADLNALVKGKTKPSTPLEEKIYLILSSYQGQFNDLVKKLDVNG